MNWVFYNWYLFKANSEARRFLSILGVSCLLIYIAGCSSVTVAYNLQGQYANTLLGTIDCESTGVEKFYAYVYRQGGENPIAEAWWMCKETAKPISNVRKGENYKVVIVAKDINDSVLFLGEQDNVRALSDTENNAGNIEMVRFSADLAEKTDDKRLCWSKVKYANKYRIQIAEDIKFVNVLVNRIIETTSYSPGLEASQVYFWRVAPINSTGIEGRLSERWSFRF